MANMLVLDSCMITCMIMVLTRYLKLTSILYCLFGFGAYKPDINPAPASLFGFLPT